MVYDEIVKRFVDLELRAAGIKQETRIVDEAPFSQSNLQGPKRRYKYYDESECLTWSLAASAAIEDTFPVGHSVRKTWEQCWPESRAFSFGHRFEQRRSIFGVASELIRKKQLNSLIDAIRVESETEFLTQAEILLSAGHIAAATVIAGGAMEMHLKTLCDRHKLTFPGDPSIAKYNGAIAAARGQGTIIYTAADGDLVGAWGKFRNDAAHSPGSFARTAHEIEQMIAGIRSLMVRVS